jgi:integrase
MYRETTVNLNSNGQYWQAVYRDRAGRRRVKSLGPKAKVSKRQARLLCTKLSNDLQHSDATAIKPGELPTLEQWVERFLGQKANLSKSAESSYRLAAKKLSVTIDPATRIDHITSTDAADWAATLAKQNLAAATVANYARHVRCIFNEAVHQELLLRNPFQRLRTQPRNIERDWHYVDRKTFSRILRTAPNPGWRSFLALQRLGCLRVSEALAVEWGMIEWEHRTLALPSRLTKTGKPRVVPLETELHSILKQASQCGEMKPHELIVSREHVVRCNRSNRHKILRAILRRLNIEPWEDLFQTLRRNGIQDLRALLKDPWAVTEIAGNSEAVQRKYYLGNLREEDVAKVTGRVYDRSLEAITSAWPSLSRRNKAKLLRTLRQNTSGARNATKLPQNERQSDGPLL